MVFEDQRPIKESRLSILVNVNGTSRQCLQGCQLSISTSIFLQFIWKIPHSPGLPLSLHPQDFPITDVAFPNNLHPSIPRPPRLRTVAGLFISRIHRSTTRRVKNGRVIYLGVFLKLLRISEARHVTLARRRSELIYGRLSAPRRLWRWPYIKASVMVRIEVGALEEMAAGGNAWPNSSMFYETYYERLSCVFWTVLWSEAEKFWRIKCRDEGA